MFEDVQEKKVFLGLDGITVNLSTMSATLNSNNEKLELIKDSRLRSLGQRRTQIDIEPFEKLGKVFAKDQGEYAHHWAKMVKKNVDYHPSVQEMIDGLYNSYEEKVNKYLNTADQKTKKEYLKRVRYAFDFIIESLAI